MANRVCELLLCYLGQLTALVRATRFDCISYTMHPVIHKYMMHNCSNTPALETGCPGLNILPDFLLLQKNVCDDSNSPACWLTPALHIASSLFVNVTSLLADKFESRPSYFAACSLSDSPQPADGHNLRHSLRRLQPEQRRELHCNSCCSCYGLFGGVPLLAFPMHLSLLDISLIFKAS